APGLDRARSRDADARACPSRADAPDPALYVPVQSAGARLLRASRIQSGEVRRRLRQRGEVSGRPVRVATLGLQHVLGNALDVRRVDLTLVSLHDVSDEPADLLGVGDLERVQPLTNERAERGLVQALGQVAIAELELEAKLRGVRGAALADLLVFRERLLQLLAISADHVEHERVVDRAGESLGGAALADLRLDHPDHVGRLRVLLLDRLRQRLVQRLLERHDPSWTTVSSYELLYPQPGVEHVTKTVTQEVQAQAGDGQRQPGEEAHP